MIEAELKARIGDPATLRDLGLEVMVSPAASPADAEAAEGVQDLPGGRPPHQITELDVLTGSAARLSLRSVQELIYRHVPAV